MKKFLALLTALMLLSAMFTGALAIYIPEVDDLISDIQSWDDEPEPTEAPRINTIATSLEGVQNAYTVVIDGATYAMPFPMQSLMAAGWSMIEEYESLSLEPMTYYSAIMSNAADQDITVYFMNADPEATIPFTESEVFAITVDDPSIDFAMASGVKLGDDIDNVIAAYGDGYTENSVTDGGRTVQYSFYKILASLAESIQTQVNVKGNFSDKFLVWADASDRIYKIELENTIF